ncbi:MAG: hypothetical protein CME64_02030 [Halobacteriovoraceae bacterium]|nr:hypothetical protein [Halobacteriovoraceae bacterium]|tara:strand:- start:14994 stop:15344 length:351 start_codon:yes stop_codon:yes gene_type:complete
MIFLYGCSQASGELNLSSVLDLRHVKLPDGFDMSGFDSTRVSLSNMDLFKTKNLAVQMLELREVRGLTADHINNASNVSMLKYPKDFDFTGVNFTSKSLYGADFSNLQHIGCEKTL